MSTFFLSRVNRIISIQLANSCDIFHFFSSFDSSCMCSQQMHNHDFKLRAFAPFHNSFSFNSWAFTNTMVLDRNFSLDHLEPLFSRAVQYHGLVANERHHATDFGKLIFQSLKKNALCLCKCVCVFFYNFIYFEWMDIRWCRSLKAMVPPIKYCAHIITCLWDSGCCCCAGTDVRQRNRQISINIEWINASNGHSCFFTH